MDWTSQGGGNDGGNVGQTRLTSGRNKTDGIGGRGGGAQEGKILKPCLCRRASRQNGGRLLQDHPITSPHISSLHLKGYIQIHKVPFPDCCCAAAIFTLPFVCRACEVPDVNTPAKAALSGIGMIATMAAKQLRALCTIVAQLSNSGMSWQIMLSSSFPPCSLLAEL